MFYDLFWHWPRRRHRCIVSICGEDTDFAKNNACYTVCYNKMIDKTINHIVGNIITILLDNEGHDK